MPSSDNRSPPPAPPPPPRRADGTRPRVEVHPAGRRIRLRGPESPPGERGERLTLWWGVTSAAFALGEHLLEGPDLGGRRVLELGCGLGLAGIAAGLAGAHVTFSDGEQDALDRAERNAVGNGVAADRLATLRLDWERTGEVGRFDLLLGAEIGYDSSTHGDLVTLIPRLLAPGGRALLADRRRRVVERLIGRLRGTGLAVSWTQRVVDEPDLPRQEITIFELSGSPSPA